MGFRARALAVIKVLIPALLIAAQGALLLLFTYRWVGTSALTIIPFWAYGIIALAASLLCLAILRNGFSIAAALIWLATLLTCPDEMAGLARIWHEAPAPGTPALAADNVQPLRVVTLNCRKHNLKCLDVIKEWQPDIILLQESPYRSYLSKLATDLYGKDGGMIAMPSWDCAIVARGKITVRQTAPYFTQAKVELANGRSVEVVSLHLHGAATSLSLHRRKTWQLHTTSRQVRLAEMANIHQSILKYAPYRTCIIGGDFNSPAGDRVYFSLRNNNFTDSFRTTGKGWGDTVMSRYPVHRIDQIWASSDTLRPIRSRTVTTEHSDHKMVVSDFVWK
ncbi:MAG: endonuclease/exonuclease/phosphatase family protein [Verrucomicrobiales bacterium]